jgi:hypothetical protein
MRVKLKNQNNINFDWIIKLKTNKTLTKKPMKKIKIKRIRTEMKKKTWEIIIEGKTNKTLIKGLKLKYQKQRGQSCIFFDRREKRWG